MESGSPTTPDAKASILGAVAVRLGLCVAMPAVASCSGIQSTLDPAGEEARQVAQLFWVMVVGGGAIWLAVVGLLLYATRERRPLLGEHHVGRLIFWAGAAVPSLLLFALLGYALWLLPWLRPFADASEPKTLRVEVTGEQFWWRIAYQEPGGAQVHAANEIRLPVGERVEFVLRATDVIHSFWIPSLGGKMDMIPGRENRLSLLATKPGIYRGACAEYCGASHALMAFTTIVMEPQAFRDWLAAQAASSPGIPAAGREHFLRNGCGACHRVAGTEADGTVGPDLSHVGSRMSIGAGTLANDEASLARFTAHPEFVKPGSRMPGFSMLSKEDVAAIAGWLRGLK